MEIIDSLVLSSFLLATLVIGTIASKGIFDIKSFAVGNRNYGIFALLATLSASYIGGGYTFGVSEKCFSSGIIYSFCLLGFSLQLFLVAKFIAPKMYEFYDAYSVGDIMYRFYGNIGRFITGIASTIVCAGIIGAQVKATGFVFNLFLGIEPIVGIAIGCSIVIVYSVFGGIKAVVATDILQFCVLIIAIPLTLTLGIKYVGGIDSLLGNIPSTHLSIPGNLSWPTVTSIFMSLLLGEALVPPYVQRLFLARDPKTTERGTLTSSIMSIPFFMTGGLIGLVAFSINPQLDPNMALPFVVDTVLPVGIKGLAVAGIIACIMSSADSYLNASAISLIHDLIKPVKPDLTAKAELHLTRLVTLLIGIIAIVFAISIESALDILLYSYNFWSPVILVPLVFGIIGIRLSKQEFIISSSIGVATVITWNIFLADKTGFDGLVIGVITNLITASCLYLVRAK